jgi:hypothetical protein
MCRGFQIAYGRAVDIVRWPAISAAVKGSTPDSIMSL